MAQTLPFLSKRFLWNFLFITSLVLTLFSDRLLWLTRIGWMVLPILFVLDTEYAIAAVFFFASFFHPAGFFPEFFFTLKHYALSLLLLVTVQLIKSVFFKSVFAGLKNSGLLRPILWFIAIAAFSGCFHGEPWKAFRITTNLFLVILSLIYVRGVMLTHGFPLKKGVIFFTLGISIQIVLGLLNFVYGKNWFELKIIHHNHMGIIAAFTTFHALALALSEKSRLRRSFLWLLTAIVFLGLVFSCSRTAWISFAVSYACFAFLIVKYIPASPVSARIKRSLKFSCAFFVLLLTAGLMASTDVYLRVAYLSQLLDINSWIYMFHDYQNFGFLGIARLKQHYDLWQILKGNFFFGAGMIRQVVDFHGLYFTILGSSGIAGLLAFAYFCRSLFHKLLALITRQKEGYLLIMRVGAFSALLVWILSSFMETLFLQYSIWLNVLIAIALIPAGMAVSIPKISIDHLTFEPLNKPVSVPFVETILPLEARHRTEQVFWHFFFMTSLIFTFLTKRWFLPSILGWIGIGICSALDIRYTLYAIFLFSAFFQPPDFFQVPFFTIKHFHIALFIAIMVQAMRGRFWQTFFNGVKQFRLFLPVAAIILIAFLSGISDKSGKAFRVTINLSLTLLAFVYILGLIQHNASVFKQCLRYFLIGVGLQISVGLINFFTHQNYFGIHLVHNNHLSMLSACAFFYALAFPLYERTKTARLLHLALAALISLGPIFGCSRTVFVSLLTSLVLFCYFLFRKFPTQKLGQLYSRRYFIALGFALAIAGDALMGFNFFEYFYWRMNSIPALFHGYYWKYSLQDYQNFGFFGSLRLNQLYELGDILKHHFFLGVGFTTQVIGFHNLYFTILGASGIIGLLLFAIFVRNSLNLGLKTLPSRFRPELFLFRIAAMCAFTTWLFCSFLETIFLHFFVWLNILAILVLSDPQLIKGNQESGGVPGVPTRNKVDLDSLVISESNALSQN